MSDIKTDNIKYAISCSNMTIHQKADALQELEKLNARIELLELKNKDLYLANEAKQREETALNTSDVSVPVCLKCNGKNLLLKDGVCFMCFIKEFIEAYEL